MVYRVVVLDMRRVARKEVIISSRLTMKTKQEYEKEEWGGWKIVSDMLDHPTNGIYPTSECYKKLYDFVCAQKEKALLSERQEIVKEVKGMIDEIPRVLIGDKMVRVESIQQAVDAEQHEYIDTCKIYARLESIITKGKRR